MDTLPTVAQTEESDLTPSSRVDPQIREFADWRGQTLARIRTHIREADTDVVEMVKWVKPSNPNGVPIWEHAGILCTGEHDKDMVKLNFAFTNSPMEDEIVHHVSKFPVFGTEPKDAELEALGRPPVAQDPRIPTHGFYPDSPKEWLAHHRAILRDEASQPWQIVFLGDSITQGWLKTQEWNTFFKPRGAFNMGIGGDRTSQLLWRIEHGELDHVRPKVVVLMIGTNNMWADYEKYGAQAVAEGTQRVVTAIQHKLPGAKILLPDVPPMLKDPEQSVRGRIRAVNEATDHLADGKTVMRVPVGSLLLEDSGEIDPSIMSDFVHPTAIGYTKIAKILQIAVESAL